MLDERENQSKRQKSSFFHNRTLRHNVPDTKPFESLEGSLDEKEVELPFFGRKSTQATSVYSKKPSER